MLVVGASAFHGTRSRYVVEQQQGGGGGLLGNLLLGQKGFMGISPQSVQENGLVGSLVNRLTAGANPSTGEGMPMPPQAAPPPSPMPPAAVPQPSFQLPPMANMASNAPNGLLGQLFGGGMPA
jgi:hypothetical protein